MVALPLTVGLSEPSGYAEISAVDVPELGHSVESLDLCKARCDKVHDCKGIKYTAKSDSDSGDCTLLAAPSEGQPAEVESTKEEEKAKVARPATRPSKSMVITVPKHPSHNRLFSAGNDALREVAQAGILASKQIKAIKKTLKDGPSPTPMSTPKLIRKVMEAKKDSYTCEFAKQLHDKYITRVANEVELDEKRQPSNIKDTVLKETLRANRIVARRAVREADTKLRRHASDLERKVMNILEREDGHSKAQKFLEKLQKKACKVEEIKTSEIPEIHKVDSWDNCAEMKDNCDDAKVLKNCAKTCQ